MAAEIGGVDIGEKEEGREMANGTGVVFAVFCVVCVVD